MKEWTKLIVGVSSLVLGWVSLVTATFFWVGYSIYELVRTDAGFFSIVLPNVGFWVLQLIVGLILLMVGAMSLTLNRSTQSVNKYSNYY